MGKVEMENSRPHLDSRATLRVAMEKQAEPVRLFEELYREMARTADGVPLGALKAHAQERMKQSYMLLAVIEHATRDGLLGRDTRFVATGARIQDKIGSRNQPAAHSLPCDLSIDHGSGRKTRFSEEFQDGLSRVWIESNVFAPTDRVHRLINVVDRNCEDAGMKHSLVLAANAVVSGKMTANQAMREVVEPGYAVAAQKVANKLDRNMSLLERDVLAHRIIDANGRPAKSLSEPLYWHVQSLEARAAAKEAIGVVLDAYVAERSLDPSSKMEAAIAAEQVVDNEREFRERGPDAPMASASARHEAASAWEEAQQKINADLDAIKRMAAQADEALVAASDPSRTHAQRLEALGDAQACSENMKQAWTVLQRTRAPEIVGQMDARLNRCAPFGERERELARQIMAAPPRELIRTAQAVEDVSVRFEQVDRAATQRRDQRADNLYDLSPRMSM